MINATDSYFEYVSGRMAAINPSRQVVGIMDAMDWPPKNVVLEAFYLLIIGQRPVKGFSTVANPVYSHTLQWTWLIRGTDLTAGVVGRSRGDRYRTNMIMRNELLKGSWAWFCEKQSWAVLGTTPSGLVLQGTPVSPIEDVFWGPLTFMNRIDRESGIVYGTATIQLTDMQQQITS